MILLDGPMGTELDARGVATPAPGWSAHALESAPDVVRSIHAEHARAGAEVLRTNTFRTQPRIFPDRWRALVASAVALAREARHDGVRVAGSIAPIEDCYRPDLSPPPDVARVAHRALARALAEEKVDLLVCETFPHPGEACIAVEEAVRTGIETWVALTAGPDASLMTPEVMDRAARDCVRAGATAVLVCCTDAEQTLPYVQRLARIGVPFGAYANGVDPRYAPERYATIARRWALAGASIVGACCGNGVAHVAALAAQFPRT